MSTSRVEFIEMEVASLSAEELAVFREWFSEFDAAAWDAQIEKDSQNGKLQSLADEALREHKAGKSTDL
jgi:hypothetical protein